MDANVVDEEVTLQGGGDGDQVSCYCSPQAPLNRGGCCPHPQHTCGWIKVADLRITTFSGDATLGKTEVLFEQRYQKVQCVKNHYPESVVQESIIRSLKGAAADMAQYMGPTATVSLILRKLSVIFSMVASFDILMQTFIK